MTRIFLRVSHNYIGIQIGVISTIYIIYIFMVQFWIKFESIRLSNENIVEINKIPALTNTCKNT